MYYLTVSEGQQSGSHRSCGSGSGSRVVSRKLLAVAAAEGWTGAGGAASPVAHLMAVGV